MAQTVKNLPALQETWVWSLGWEEPLEEEMATHCYNLAWRIPWTEEPGGLQSMGSQRVRHGWATNAFTSFSLSPRPSIFHQPLLSTVPWSFQAKKTCPWVCGRKGRKVITEAMPSPPFSCHPLSRVQQGLSKVQGGPWYLTALLESKSSPQTRDGTKPQNPHSSWDGSFLQIIKGVKVHKACCSNLSLFH